MQTWDALVIGSGQAGVPLAVALARAGRRTAVVERGDVGGTCVNVGCTPTKTLVASARVASLARRGVRHRGGTAPGPLGGGPRPGAGGRLPVPGRRRAPAA